ncbi:hypothetical protein [Cellulomonas sp. URHE0023]|uniref:hypothetical protein n=1 Tax=Cellulomonas sp. URHE0023 TaxID=1380354 RepID=UPI00068B9B70|nr:hypothetical protein [Cellulomonas sp. URHE0023]
MVAQRDVLEMLRDAAVRALDESWDMELPSTLVEREWVTALRSLRVSLRGTWPELGLDVLLRGPERDEPYGPSDARIFGESVDAFLVALGVASADDVASAVARLLDRRMYRDPELAGPATHAGIDVVRAAHRILGIVLDGDAFWHLKEFTANTEALEWDIHDRQAWESAHAETGSERSILERLSLFRGLRPRRRAAALPMYQPPAGPRVNVAILAATGPAEHQPWVEPGSHIWFSVSVGPQQPDDDAPAPLPRFSLPKRTPRELIDVVVLPDASGDEPLESQPSGQLRISPDGPFAVTRPAGRGPVGNGDSRRLYFALQAPDHPGDWRVRCVLAVRGVVVHVEQVTVVVGEGDTESSAQTTFQLVEDLAAPAALAGLDTATLALCASGGGAGMQGFSFLLADEDGIEAAQVYLPSYRVSAFVDAVRVAIDEVTWVTREPYVQGAVTWHSWNWAALGDPQYVATHLVALARAGRPVWEDLSEALDRFPDLAARLREKLTPRGVVQLAVEQDADLVVPVQFLYDFPLRTTAPLGELSVCDATMEWLGALVGEPSSDDEHHGPDEPSCVAGPCPQEGDDSRVCIAGFWGYWHQVSSNLASTTALSVPSR